MHAKQRVWELCKNYNYRFYINTILYTYIFHKLSWLVTKSHLRINDADLYKEYVLYTDSIIHT